VAVVEGECLVLGRLEGRVGRLWGRQGVEVLWTRQAALGEVGHSREHFRGRVRAEIAVLQLTRLQVVLEFRYFILQLLHF